MVMMHTLIFGITNRMDNTNRHFAFCIKDAKSFPIEQYQKSMSDYKVLIHNFDFAFLRNLRRDLLHDY